MANFLCGASVVFMLMGLATRNQELFVAMFACFLTMYQIDLPKRNLGRLNPEITEFAILNYLAVLFGIGVITTIISITSNHVVPYGGLTCLCVSFIVNVWMDQKIRHC